MPNQQVNTNLMPFIKINRRSFVVPQTPATAPVSGPKTPLSSSENIKFSFTNPDKSQSQTSKEDKTSTESSTPANPSSQLETKTSIFGNFGGTSNSIFGGATPVSNPSGSIFGARPTIKPANNTGGSGFSFPGFGASPAPGAPPGGFQFTTPSTSAASNTSSTFSFGTTGNQPLFGGAAKFSFADISKQASNNDKSLSNGTEQRGKDILIRHFFL